MSNAGDVRGGIDLGGTKIQAVVVNGDHVVLGQARHPTPTTGGPQDVWERRATRSRLRAARGRHHVSRIYRKLGLRNRAEAAAYALGQTVER